MQLSFDIHFVTKKNNLLHVLLKRTLENNVFTTRSVFLKQGRGYDLGLVNNLFSNQTKSNSSV